MLKKISIICASVLSSAVTIAQNEIGLYNMNYVHQSSFLNVSNQSDYKFSLGLPGIGSVYSAAGNSGFSLVKDLIDSTSADKKDWYTDASFVDNLKKKNITYVASSVDLLSFRFKTRHSFYSFAITEQMQCRFMYPKDLFGVLIKGNGEYIGKDIVFDNLQLNAQYYREYALGYQKELKNKWSFGFRLKLLQGLASVHTSKSVTKLHVDSNEEGNNITASSNIVINTSYNKIFEKDSGVSNDEYIKALTSFKNLGAAVDLGVTYKLNKRLQIAGSVNNLGFISWKDNPNNYKLAGDAKFSGVVIRDLTAGDSVKLTLDSWADSLGKKFKFDTSHNKYSSMLVGSSSVNLNYQVFRNTYLNALIQASFYKGARFAYSVGINQKIARWFALTGYWSAQYGKYDNIGAGFMIKPACFQIYAICDNLMPLLKSLDGNEIDATKFDFRNSNLRFGVNIAIGRFKTPDIQTFEK